MLPTRCFSKKTSVFASFAHSNVLWKIFVASGGVVLKKPVSWVMMARGSSVVFDVVSPLSCPAYSRGLGESD